jgi:hypothetical protein
MAKRDEGTQAAKLREPQPHGVYELSDGEWVPIGAFRHHICCGCGMEHKVETRINAGVMQERWTTTKDPRQSRRPRKKKQ